jgi:hypothetical protein
VGTGLAEFRERLAKGLNSTDAGARPLLNRVAQLQLPRAGNKWTDYRNFWPPTVLEAARSETLLVFFGAGVSAAADFPTWRELLEKRLGIPADFLADESLKWDALTLGEIASRLVGREQLQDMLRSIYTGDAQPTLGHYAFAAMRLPIYITTNYDCLFEKAWSNMKGPDLAVICNSEDAERCRSAPYKLYKIHGSANRTDEVLVLTRADYRRHYRANLGIFEEITGLLRDKPTVFSGFSHSDPEVSRLIDDVIWDYEGKLARKLKVRAPDFYNMQFESTYVANERFAAKGMVSLNIRASALDTIDPRTTGMAESIAELVDAAEREMDSDTSVSVELDRISLAILADLEGAIAELERIAPALYDLVCGRSDAAVIEAKLVEVDPGKALATQGIYVVDRDGRLVARRFTDQDAVAREAKLNEMRQSFSLRPYFRQAKTFRRAFVSDLFGSVFNGNSTFAICVPLLRGEQFGGIVFAACQVGQWDTPIRLRAELDPELGLYVMDGHGSVALPPNSEFKCRPSPEILTEPESSRVGYSHQALQLLSRKDRVILQLAGNIIPVEKDDDVISLNRELDVYARLQALGELGWRCAVARTIRFTP